jgi:surface carbohydrate biosynthesis protein
MQTYLYGYIALVKPKVIVTLIDNSLPFYFINHRFPKATTIAIQNGRRDNFGRKPNTGFLDLLQIDHGWGKPTISHYCMFGEAEISLLRKYIRANFIATGNLQNNSRQEPGQRFHLFLLTQIFPMICQLQHSHMTLTCTLEIVRFHFLSTTE